MVSRRQMDRLLLESKECALSDLEDSAGWQRYPATDRGWRRCEIPHLGSRRVAYGCDGDRKDTGVWRGLRVRPEPIVEGTNAATVARPPDTTDVVRRQLVVARRRTPGRSGRFDPARNRHVLLQVR